VWFGRVLKGTRYLPEIVYLKKWFWDLGHADLDRSFLYCTLVDAWYFVRPSVRCTDKYLLYFTFFLRLYCICAYFGNVLVVVLTNDMNFFKLQHELYSWCATIVIIFLCFSLQHQSIWAGWRHIVGGHELDSRLDDTLYCIAWSFTQVESHVCTLSKFFTWATPCQQVRDQSIGLNLS